MDAAYKGPRDACGLFGVWAPGEEVAKLAYFGLYALQHRGQESAGIAASDGERMLVFKDLGLVSQVFDETALVSLTGHIAVAHNRYSMSGAPSWVNAQPTLAPTPFGTIALAHNGALTNTEDLARQLAQHSELKNHKELEREGVTDTVVMTALLSVSQQPTLVAAVRELLPQLAGAYSLVFMDEHKLYAARDPQGVRPLMLGQLESGGWVVASEAPALDIVGAKFVREVEPGELITIDETGVSAERFATSRPQGCVFEYIYLARPDTVIAGRSVQTSRLAMGRALAEEYPVAADLVIPVPESGTPAAVGYAQAAGIPFAQGLTKNSYVGRTFIQPSQTLRKLGLRLKLNPMREVVAGKRLVVVDDSIVRGNTQKAIVQMLRDAGATEIHVRISSPPVKWPCFYGVDFASREELISVDMSPAEICEFIGADSLGFVSLEGMIGATGIAEDKLCASCFTGTYRLPTPVGARSLLSDAVLMGDE